MNSLEELKNHFFEKAKAEYRIYKRHIESEQNKQGKNGDSTNGFPIFIAVFSLINFDEKRISEILNSADAQTYKPEQIISFRSQDEFSDFTEGISKENKANRYLIIADASVIFEPFAFFEAGKYISENNNPDLIYSDEELFDKNESVLLPYFKPEFSPDTLRSFNYIGNFFIVSEELFKNSSLEKNEFDIYDLILKTSEKAKTIKRIPKILFRADIEFKEIGNAHSRAVLTRHLSRKGLEFSEITSNKGINKITYKIKNNPPVSIIIPNKNNAALLKRCVESITSKTSYNRYEIIIVENGSSEIETFNYYDVASKNAVIKVINWNKPFNYSSINNFAVSNAQGEHIVLLNNDIEIITPNWIEEMLAFSQREDVGAVGCKLLYPDGTIQHAGLTLGIFKNAVHTHPRFGGEALGYFGRVSAVSNVSAVTGACLMTPRSVYEELGGLEEKYTLGYGDIDYCLKARKKYLVIFTPFAQGIHHESLTRGTDQDGTGRKRAEKELAVFHKRWGENLKDPYYNPNLSPTKRDYSLNDFDSRYISALQNSSPYKIGKKFVNLIKGIF